MFCRLIEAAFVPQDARQHCARHDVLIHRAHQHIAPACRRRIVQHPLAAGSRRVVFAEVMEGIAAQPLGHEQSGLIIGAAGHRRKLLHNTLSGASLADIDVQSPQRPKSAELGLPIVEAFAQSERLRQCGLCPIDMAHRQAK